MPSAQHAESLAGLGDPYPSFSFDEMHRRRVALERGMSQGGLTHLIVYGTSGSTAIPWLTGWHVTREAIALVTPGEPISVFVQLYNHVPNARELAPLADVFWGGESSFETVRDVLARKTGVRSRVGWIGPLPVNGFDLLRSAANDLVDVTDMYTELRLVKSAEELEWIRRGAAMTDAALDAMLAALEPGARESDLAAAVESAYVADGGRNHLHFFAVTSMGRPTRCVPAQWPSQRHVDAGDLVITELSASFWGYPGQLLRTVTVEQEPSALVGELHRVADAALRAIRDRVRGGVHVEELVEASRVIDEAGFTIYDDLVHGFGGGYLPPVLGTLNRPNSPTPDMTLESGMTIVIQPNVVTMDARAGVQTGELFLVTDNGAERLHSAPQGLLRR